MASCCCRSWRHRSFSSIQRSFSCTAASIWASVTQVGAVTCRPSSFTTRPMLLRRDRRSTKPMGWCSVCTSRQRAPGGREGGGLTARGVPVGAVLRGDAGDGGAGGAAASGSNRLSCLFSSGIAFGVELAHFILYPVLNLAVDLFGIESGGFDGGADGDGDEARPFDKGVLGPAFARIVRDRYDHGAGSCGQQRTSHFIASRLAGGDARAFGKKQGPTALVEALLAQPHDLLECIAPLAAVDGYHAQQRQAPAEEGNAVELFLVDE